MKQLKVLIWNLQDLFIFLDKHQAEDIQSITEPKWQLLSSSLKANKELAKVKDIAKLIDSFSFDICLLTEIGGKESLDNLNKFFLNSNYSVIHYPSNSDRGIDLGALVKVELLPLMKHKFHNHKVFARGALQLELRLDDKNHFRFFVTHLKSKLSKESDFEGRSQRSLEVMKLCEIYTKENSKKEIPTFICGDFNGVISGADTEEELAYFEQSSGLIDIFEHLGRGTFDRGTYAYFNRQGILNLMQLDYAVCETQWKDLVLESSAVVDFEGQYRSSIEVSRSQRMQAPSDHYPIKLNLKIK